MCNVLLVCNFQLFGHITYGPPLALLPPALHISGGDLTQSHVTNKCMSQNAVLSTQYFHCTKSRKATGPHHRFTQFRYCVYLSAS